MLADPSAPADTTMMRIVHDALRRDLRRARVVLTRVPRADDRQRAAVAEHLRWLTAFLESHHRSEDLGLFPLVRERDPGAAALLDAMARDHAAVVGAIGELAAAGAATSGRDDPGSLVAALDGLTDVLIPHLRWEEDELMPVVARVVTDAEWRAVERRYNLDGKSLAQLGREGHWLIDGATPEDRARVLGLVPPAPRLLLRYGFGPSYRRRARLLEPPARAAGRFGHGRGRARNRRGVGRRARSHPGRRVESRVHRVRVGRRDRRGPTGCTVPGPEPAGPDPVGTPVRGRERRAVRAGVAHGAHATLPGQHRVGAAPRGRGRGHGDRADLRGRARDEAGGPLRDHPARPPGSHRRAAAGPRADRCTRAPGRRHRARPPAPSLRAWSPGRRPPGATSSWPRPARPPRSPACSSSRCR